MAADNKMLGQLRPRRASRRRRAACRRSKSRSTSTPTASSNVSAKDKATEQGAVRSASRRRAVSPTPRVEKHGQGRRALQCRRGQVKRQAIWSKRKQPRPISLIRIRLEKDDQGARRQGRPRSRQEGDRDGALPTLTEADGRATDVEDIKDEDATLWHAVGSMKLGEAIYKAPEPGSAPKRAAPTMPPQGQGGQASRRQRRRRRCRLRPRSRTTTTRSPADLRATDAGP
jgi:hypothetical protein